MMLAFKNTSVNETNELGGTVPVQSASTKIFGTIMGCMVEGLTAKDGYYAMQARQHAIDSLSRNSKDLSLIQANELMGWLKYLDRNLISEYTTEQMSYVLHTIYIGSCEYFGPTWTDKLLAQSIDKVKKMPEASVFDPESIL